MIVTLDTGILVRATARSNGPARQLLQRIADNPLHVIVASPFILGEVGKALSCPRMNAALGITAEEIHQHVGYLRGICRIVEPQLAIPVVLRIVRT